jgi:hypothetical protein
MLTTVAYRMQIMDILDRYSTITNDPIAADTFLLDMFSIVSPACPMELTMRRLENGTVVASVQDRPRTQESRPAGGGCGPG